MIQRLYNFLYRWQEHSGWMPLTIGLAILAWAVLGSLDRTAALDALPLIVVLPIKIAYVLAAAGATHLIRRRWRKTLDAGQQEEWWARLMNGEKGPMLILVVDAVFSLCALYWLLQFFNLPS